MPWYYVCIGAHFSRNMKCFMMDTLLMIWSRSCVSVKDGRKIFRLVPYGWPLSTLVAWVWTYNEEKQPSIRGLEKGFSEIIQQIYRKHPCRSAISIKLFCNVIEIALQHGYSPVNLLHIFRTPFCKNAYGGLLLNEVEDTNLSSRNDLRFQVLICTWLASQNLLPRFKGFFATQISTLMHKIYKIHS